MDEKLIGEVQQHAIIYNRQKSNTLNGDKCITKELAWQDIARNLGTDGKFAVRINCCSFIQTVTLTLAITS